MSSPTAPSCRPGKRSSPCWAPREHGTHRGDTNCPFSNTRALWSSLCQLGPHHRLSLLHSTVPEPPDMAQSFPQSLTIYLRPIVLLPFPLHEMSLPDPFSRHPQRLHLRHSPKQLVCYRHSIPVYLKQQDRKADVCNNRLQTRRLDETWLLIAVGP